MASDLIKGLQHQNLSIDRVLSIASQFEGELEKASGILNAYTNKLSSFMEDGMSAIRLVNSKGRQAEAIAKEVGEAKRRIALATDYSGITNVKDVKGLSRGNALRLHYGLLGKQISLTPDNFYPTTAATGEEASMTERFRQMTILNNIAASRSAIASSKFGTFDPSKAREFNLGAARDAAFFRGVAIANARERMRLMLGKFRSDTNSSNIGKYFSNERKSNLEADRRASQLLGERIAEERDDNKEIASMRARIIRAREMRRDRFGVRSKQERENNRRDITRGIESAFGGKGALKSLAKGMGLYYGVSSIGRAIRFLTISNPIEQAKFAQQIGINSSYSGSSIKDLSTMGYALKAYGGGVSNAVTFMQKINQFAQGALVGKGLGSFGAAALQYGLNVTGSGPAGLATKDELIERISNKLATMDAREKADMAATLGIDAPTFSLMKDGYKSYLERIKYAEKGNPFFDDVRASQLQKTGENINLISAEIEKIKNNLVATDFVSTYADFIKKNLEGINSILSLSGERSGDITPPDYIKNPGLYDGIKFNPIPTYSAPSTFDANSSANNVFDVKLDFGNINVSTEARQEARELLTPWLLKNVIYPMQNTEK